LGENSHKIITLTPFPTAFQSIGFATLWIVRSTSAALAFPFFVVGMIPFRLSFRLIFSKQELDAVK
jgi:hypothetical protein